MPGLSSGEKELLVMTACAVDTAGKVTLQDKRRFQVMLNPSSYRHKEKLSYSYESSFGQVGNEMKFSGAGGDDVNFDITIDGTGVVSPSGGGAGYDDVKTQIRALHSVVYDYVGNDHEPSVVQVLWGTLIFVGRLTSIAVEYTLFKPSGDPLRAKVSLAFVGFMSKKKQALVANRSSPDLTHTVEVREGDTLPLLCHRIYKDSSRYMEVARYNDINAFRSLEPGTRVTFPPLAPGLDRDAPESGIRKYPPVSTTRPPRRRRRGAVADSPS